MALSPGHERGIRIAVRSERRLFRDALAACLAAQPEYDIVGHAADLDDLIVLCDLRHPDVVLVDVGASVGTAPELLGRLRACVSVARLVVVYERLSPAELAALWRLGVDTLVPCSHGLDALLMVLRRYAGADQDAPRRSALNEDGLSDQEHEIITLVSAGHTVDRIAELLEISTSAVANTKRRIYHKLEVASQSQAVARAAALGLVGRPTPHAVSNGKGNGALLAVLRGGDGAVRQRVAAALLAGGIPFAIEVRPGRLDNDAEHHDGRVLLVLMDPGPADWPGERDPAMPVAVVHDERTRRTEVVEALLRGAVAFVSVDRVATDLVPALMLAMHGYLAVDGSAAGPLLDAVRAPCTTARGLPELTARECDILRSIADGHTVRQTARVLGIAEKTVENTQARLFRKLGARNRAGALAAAHALGLLEELSSRESAVRVG